MIVPYGNNPPAPFCENCDHWCEVEEPTQEEFDWEETGKKLLDLEIKINPTNKFDAETLKEKRSIILLVWHDFLFEPIFAFIKSHCVPREAWDEERGWRVEIQEANWGMSKKFDEMVDKLTVANQEIALLRGKLEEVSDWFTHYKVSDEKDYFKLKAILTPTAKSGEK